MLVFHDPLRQTDLPRGCVATIGNFDGMHVGHQQIVRGVVERARFRRRDGNGRDAEPDAR